MTETIGEVVLLTCVGKRERERESPPRVYSRWWCRRVSRLHPVVTSGIELASFRRNEKTRACLRLEKGYGRRASLSALPSFSNTLNLIRAEPLVCRPKISSAACACRCRLGKPLVCHSARTRRPLDPPLSQGQAHAVQRSGSTTAKDCPWKYAVRMMGQPTDGLFVRKS